MKRILAGLLLAPLIAVTNGLVLGGVLTAWQEHKVLPTSAQEWTSLAVMALLSFAIAYTAALLFGLPFLLVLRRWRVVKPWLYALAGVLCAAGICGGMLLIPSGCGEDDVSLSDMLRIMAFFSAVLFSGGMGGLTFWRIAVRDNRHFLKEAVACAS